MTRALARWNGLSVSLRLQLLALLTALLVPLGVILLLLLPAFMNEKFNAIERTQVQQFSDIARANLNTEEDRVGLFVLNFSLWTETFEYAAGRNARYLEANLVPGTFIGGKVDYWGITAPGGRLLSAATLDQNRVVDATDTVQDFLRALPDPLPQDGAAGVIQRGGRAYIVAARPITRDDGQGRGGTMLLARTLTPQVLQEITYQGQIFSAALRLDPVPDTQVQFLSDRVRATSPLSAPSGPPQLSLELSIPRAVHAAGLIGAQQLRLTMLITTLIGVSAFMLFLNRRVLSVLDGYKRDTQRIARDPTHRLDGRDPTELGLLARTINDLLDHLREREEQLRDRSQRDELTGAFTRSGLIERLDHTPVRSALLLEVPRLQELSGLYGNAMVDTLLREVTGRLNELGPQFVVARLSSSGLALITTGPDTPDPRAVLHDLERPFTLNDNDVPLKFTAGYVESPYAVPVPTLLRHANIALQHAIDEREQIALFNEEMLSRSQYGHLLEAALQGAETRDELTLLYQPIRNLSTGRWESVEALMRWKHPTLGSVPPGTFIPIAERAGLIAPLGEWAMQRALTDALSAQRIAPIRVNVNVSPIQLLSPDFAARVLKLLRDLNAPADLLTVEVTESSVMQNVDLACRHLQALRDAGIHVALDDFGSGHSSLALLADLPLDTVKLDRSFLRDNALGGTRGALLGSAIRLAGDLGLHTVAEGVEDESMLRLLQDFGCGAAQGYHIARPEPLEELLGRLQVMGR
ncbi:bifunctional diguanylate cyclase/phosphodiesterase [Deinococcus sp. JMULE3]|uniref:putative bifunctional diguanylate cyclase/phosphodiesterase n=1 Tax=Deinococcus sp. JMULE3 TaxID=2518341 RepID=UPI0015772D21|nr:EAL domain-containing protein [Deinococcus sp. JMULE3]NTX98825.1 EAL domain-containing protein [Deinococcus sp. JMULE3]